MVLVPAGEFNMGSATGNDDEKPVHAVYLDSYYIDKYEVTNILYKSCVDAGVCLPPDKSSSPGHSTYYGDPAFDNYPVIYVERFSASTYCEWRGTQLPTEAQWEKAARSTDSRTYPWGEGIDCTRANYWGCVEDLTAVGSYESGRSPYGLYDMAGNVWEWVADLYSLTYYSSLPALINNPLGPTQSRGCDVSCYVLRGGSWIDNQNSLRTTTRGRKDYYTDSYNVGFRCAKPVP